MIFILMGRSLVRGSGCLQHYGTVGGHDDQSVLLLAEGTHCDVEWYVDVMCSDRNLALPSREASVIVAKTSSGHSMIQLLTVEWEIDIDNMRSI